MKFIVTKIFFDFYDFTKYVEYYEANCIEEVYKHILTEDRYNLSIYRPGEVNSGDEDDLTDYDNIKQLFEEVYTPYKRQDTEDKCGCYITVEPYDRLFDPELGLEFTGIYVNQTKNAYT